MSPIILASIIAIGLILAIIAVIVILKATKPKKVVITKKIDNSDYIEFDDLMDLVKNSNTDSKKLLETLEKFNTNFVLDKDNEQKYLIFLSRILTHKNVNKDVFQYFHKDVKNKNRKYKAELETIERKALG